MCDQATAAHATAPRRKPRCQPGMAEECQHVSTLQLPTDHHLPISINAVNLKDRLRDIETNCCDRVSATEVGGLRPPRFGGAKAGGEPSTASRSDISAVLGPRLTWTALEEGDAFGSVGALIDPNLPSASEQARQSVGLGGQSELGLRADEG